MRTFPRAPHPIAKRSAASGFDRFRTDYVYYTSDIVINEKLFLNDYQLISYHPIHAPFLDTIHINTTNCVNREENFLNKNCRNIYKRKWNFSIFFSILVHVNTMSCIYRQERQMFEIKCISPLKLEHLVNFVASGGRNFGPRNFRPGTNFR